MMTEGKFDGRALAILCLLWILAAVAVNPVGDFPLNDDWAYAESVGALVNTGAIRFSDWSASNLISQVFWGAAFASVLGVSATVLRFSTLVAALLGAVALYRLFRLGKVSPVVALLGALVGVFNPLFFSLSFSFMTDVPYAAMQLLAMWLLASGYLLRRPLLSALGWLAAVAALLCRQLGLFLPLALAVEAAVRRPFDLKRLGMACLPVVGFLLLQRGFEYWLETTGRAPKFYGRQINDTSASLAADPLGVLALAAEMGLLAFYYIGLCALPFSLLCAPAWWSGLTARLRPWVGAVLTALAVVAFVAPVAADWAFPMWGNTLTLRSGLGTEPTGTPLPIWAVVILNLAAAIGGVLLVAALVAAAVHWWRTRIEGFDLTVFAGAVGLLTLGSIALVEMRYDRYLIPILPCVLLIMSRLLAHRPPSRHALVAAFSAVLVMGGISVGATHDLLAATRAQWRAYSDLTRTVPPARVDAGWVFNGEAQFGRYGSPYDIYSWFERADYVVGAEPREGYEIIATYPIRRWLPWNQSGRPMLVLRRLPMTAPPAPGAKTGAAEAAPARSRDET